MVEVLQRTKTNLLSDPYGVVFALSILAVIPGALVTKLILLIPILDVTSGAAAAVTEPITTKFLPAYVALTTSKRAQISTYETLTSRPIVFGVWGGFWFGVAERIMYFTDGHTVTIFWAASIALHALFGLLAGGAVYWRGKEPWNLRDVGTVCLGIASAMAIHVFWNVFLI